MIVLIMASLKVPVQSNKMVGLSNAHATRLLFKHDLIVFCCISAEKCGKWVWV